MRIFPILFKAEIDVRIDSKQGEWQCQNLGQVQCYENGWGGRGQKGKEN